MSTRAASILLLLAAPDCAALLMNAMQRQMPAALAARSTAPRAEVHAGLFDMFKETEAQKAAKEAEWKAQQEMMKRRGDPNAKAAYFEEVESRRQATAASDAELRSVQGGRRDGKDVLEDWQKLKEEGKVKASEQERDADSARLGSEGLIAERIDEKLPYIDSGYVDESQPDIMGGLKKLFGGDGK